MVLPSVYVRKNQIWNESEFFFTDSDSILTLATDHTPSYCSAVCNDLDFRGFLNGEGFQKIFFLIAK